MRNVKRESEIATRDSGTGSLTFSESRVPSPESRALWASRDRPQLEQAIWRHLTDSPGLRPSSRRPRARNPFAFDLWIAHLLLLEQMLDLAPVSWRELRADELDGLLLLRTARERFRSEYHPCADCGAPVKGKICPRCGAVS